MAAAFASTDQLEKAWRPLSDDEVPRADYLLGAASRLIRGEFPTVDDRIAREALDADLVVDVVIKMVQAAMTVPELGVTQSSDTTGPFSKSLTYANPAGDLYLTKWMRRVLGGRRRTGSAFALDLTPGA